MSWSINVQSRDPLISLKAGEGTPHKPDGGVALSRGRLQPEYGGGEIAVKVQRPGVLLSVSLDLFLMRWIAMFLDGFVRPSDTAASCAPPPELLCLFLRRLLSPSLQTARCLQIQI